MFAIRATQYFTKKLSKLVKNNPDLKVKIKLVVEILAQDPFNPKIRSHKVQDVYSSRVTGDIRIIWQYSGENTQEIQILELLDVGGHSGGSGVY